MKNSDYYNVSIDSAFTDTPCGQKNGRHRLRILIALFCFFFVMGTCCAESLSSILGQELFDAIIKGTTVKEVESLIKAGADVNFTDEDFKFSILALAIIKDESPEIIKALIKGGANVNICMAGDFAKVSQVANFVTKPTVVDFVKILEQLATEGYRLDFTPLSSAIMFKSNPETIKALVNAGALVNAKMAGDTTALMLACMPNEIENELLGEIPSWFMSGRESKWQKENFDAVSYLISKGANVNAKGSDGTTVLGHTIVDGLNLTTLKTLIKAGVDVNAPCMKMDDLGIPPLFWIPRLLSETDLFDTDDAIEAMRLLINAGANVNATVEEISVLMVALSFGTDNEIIKMLVKAGAYVNMKTPADETPLMAAMIGKKINIDSIETLLLVGADENAKDHNGKSVLMYAVDNERCDLDVIELLLKNGADVYATDNEGETALSYAKRKKDSDVYDLLLKFILNN